MILVSIPKDTDLLWRWGLTSDFSDRNYEDLVREGILAAKTDKRALARRLLLQASRLRPLDARPWLWLSQTTDDLDKRREYLERAVGVDPGNTAAVRGLAIINGQLDPDKVLPQGQGVAARAPQEPEDAGVHTFLCPQCGGRMNFDIDEQGMVCEFCGHREAHVHLAEPAVAAAERPVDFVLPTRQGHAWAEAQHRLTCGTCGAVTILPVGERTNRCAYCASLQLIDSTETDELIDPQAIGLIAVDEEEAIDRIIAWLKTGRFTPDDLVKQAGKMELRPAYFPFWTFDGTLEAPWNCEVNEGSRDISRWVPKSGTEVVMFDDVLVPGLHAISWKDLQRLHPFKLKELVAFKPDYLAGWPALAYNRAMADASLLAREAVVKRLQRTITSRVEPHREKRNLRVGGGNWSGLTFKLILLPIWIGAYRYQDHSYRVLVNGQTGKVGGDRPKDQVKVVATWAAIVVTILFLVALVILGLVLYGEQFGNFLRNLFAGS
jgi:DNA-directed RNA polymerase subunit RPC12/RpoP